MPPMSVSSPPCVLYSNNPSTVVPPPTQTPEAMKYMNLYPKEFLIALRESKYRPHHCGGKPVGLKNGGANCWMNSDKQLLYCNVHLRNALIEYLPENMCELRSALKLMRRWVVAQMASPCAAAATLPYDLDIARRQILKGVENYGGRQEDATEGLVYILAALPQREPWYCTRHASDTMVDLRVGPPVEGPDAKPYFNSGTELRRCCMCSAWATHGVDMRDLFATTMTVRYLVPTGKCVEFKTWEEKQARLQEYDNSPITTIYDESTGITHLASYMLNEDRELKLSLGAPNSDRVVLEFADLMDQHQYEPLPTDRQFSVRKVNVEKTELCDYTIVACRNNLMVRVGNTTPEILIVIFNRYSRDRKLSNRIRVPYTFDFSSLFVTESPEQVLSGTEYELQGFINHQGATGQFGHYTATICTSEAGLLPEQANWYRCDDERITSVSADNVISSVESAYVVLFRKRPANAPVVPPLPPPPPPVPEPEEVKMTTQSTLDMLARFHKNHESSLVVEQEEPIIEPLDEPYSPIVSPTRHSSPEPELGKFWELSQQRAIDRKDKFLCTHLYQVGSQYKGNMNNNGVYMFGDVIYVPDTMAAPSLSNKYFVCVAQKPVMSFLGDNEKWRMLKNQKQHDLQIAYDRFDLVKSDGLLYICIKPNVSEIPSDSPQYWVHIIDTFEEQAPSPSSDEVEDEVGLTDILTASKRYTTTTQRNLVSELYRRNKRRHREAARVRFRELEEESSPDNNFLVDA